MTWKPTKCSDRLETGKLVTLVLSGSASAQTQRHERVSAVSQRIAKKPSEPRTDLLGEHQRRFLAARHVLRNQLRTKSVSKRKSAKVPRAQLRTLSSSQNSFLDAMSLSGENCFFSSEHKAGVSHLVLPLH